MVKLVYGETKNQNKGVDGQYKIEIIQVENPPTEFKMLYTYYLLSYTYIKCTEKQL